jgi:hypothetical protein
VATRVRDNEVQRTRPQLIRWGAIFGGAVLGLGLLTLLTALWLALGYGSEIGSIRQNIEWFVGGSAVVSLFAGAYLAGWLSGTRGWGAGMINGLTIWGLLLVATVGIGVPSLLSVFNIGQVAQQAGSAGSSLQSALGLSDAPLWASFWSMIGALVAAGLGGALGGATSRPEGMYGPDAKRDQVDERRERYVDVRREGTTEDSYTDAR